MEFDFAWQQLQDKLKPRTAIPNWTVDKGYFRGSMMVVEVVSDSISVETPGAKNIQRVRKNDFEEVWRI